MHTRHLLLTALLLCGGLPVWASGVAGQVTGSSGETLPFAAIFVKETGSGTSANEDGYFELRLDPGRYTLVFQFLGYETASRTVDVSSGPFTMVNVALKQQVVQLRTVEVLSKQEDPAYTVMRKAIAKAGFHRQQIERYSAQVYIKGSGRLKKAPFFMRKELKKEGIDSSRAFVSESVSKISYQRPATFKETVISVRKQGNDNSTSPAPFINGSFYEPEIAEVISPLSPKAFAYYKFKHAGYFIDRGYGINKIQVIPRSRGDNVAEGYIYIVEDQWSIYSLDLKTYKLGIGIDVAQTYAPIEDKAWLPIKHQIDVDGTFFGFQFEYKYIATVSAYKIDLNPALDVDIKVLDEKIAAPEVVQIAKKQQAAVKKSDAEQRLATGQELTMKDLRKIVRDYEKEDRKKAMTEEKDTLTGFVAVTEYKIDSLAEQRDSVYWAEIRPVPLTLYEVRGYQRVDSIAVVEAAEKMERDSLGIAPGEDDEVEKKRDKFRPQELILGGSYRIGKRSRFSIGSMLANLNFNPVESFHSWSDLRYTTYINKKRLTLGFTPRYSLAPNRFSFKGLAEYRFGKPEHYTTLKAEGGRYIYQYNDRNPISSIMNTFYNLFQERNYIRLYEKEYFKTHVNHQLRENISLQIGAEWARRFFPDNRTTQVWFNRQEGVYESNIPVNDEWAGAPAEPEKALVLHASLEARPWQKYRMRNGSRQAIEDSSPVIGLSYRKGIPGVAGSVTDYDHIDLRFQHSFRPGARGKIDIKAEVGAFLNNNYVGFADFRHFMGNRIPIVTTDPVGSFRLLDYYRHSTAEEYAALHVHYQFRKLLLTQIPKVWLTGVKENLFVNYLATPTSKHYTELGYSLDNILRIFRIETAVAFQNGRYYDWGIRIGVASNLGFIRFD
ncbi:MAG: carboxypeptidase-like regulatory domain-containing protein [Saprospiraceae bacterium]|nr:carboxypeptidase-like regulatory domain-containing protein [Saprospiraceae bacterium]